MRKSNVSLNNEDAKYEKEVVSHFLRNIKTNVIKNHDAYLLNKLCHDCYEISREFGLNESPACLRYTYIIRETLTRHFGDEIQFSKVGKFVAVHSCKVNPLTYLVATLLGHGLREESNIRCFANLVRRKLKSSERKIEGKYVPPTSDEFLEELDYIFKPENCLFNVISLSINPKRLMDNDGYVKAPTISQAEKIAAMSKGHQLPQQ